MDLTDKFPKFTSYPPVPNWYSFNIAAIVEPDFFLYATRNIVVVLSLSGLRYFTSFIASKDKKVVALAAHGTFCVTAGSDNIVRVWNLILGSHLTSHSAHQAEITTLKLIRNGSTVISGDKSGKIVIMDLFAGGKLKSETKVKAEVTSIATTVVDDQDYVAVGYGNGLIFVEKVNTDLSMETVFQIAESNDPIHTVVWQVSASSFKLRTASEQLETATEMMTWPLLAFSTRNKKAVSVWAFPSNSLHATLRLPPPPSQATDAQKSSLWLTLAWSPYQNNRIYISHYVGTILCFEITPKGARICNAERLENHNRLVFTINHFNNGRNCITTSLDKQIILWDLTKKNKCLMSLKTQAAFPYALETPNWDYGQVAVGMGDNAIKLWNFSSKGSILEKMRPSYYKATTLWKGLQGKIEKIRWHPTREGLLAFGNDLGHIGILNVTDTSRQMFKIFHNARGAPYIDWGGDMATALNCADMTNTLMSCGQDGVIHAYDANNPKNPPFNINEKIRDLNAAWVESLIAMETFPFCIKIDEQHRFIAVGHNTGLVEVYNLKDLKVIYVSNYHRQLIKALDWKYFEGRVLLASGASDGTIAVHDINTHDLQNLPDIPVPRPEPAYRVNGHRNGINELKWGPHKDKCLLASASDDSFAIVWSIPDCKAVSLFNKHRYRVLSISWNLEEPNFIFTGSEDRFIYEWNYTDFLCSKSIDAYLPLFDEEAQKFNLHYGKRKVDTEGQSMDINADAGSMVAATTQQKKKQKQKKSANTKLPQETPATRQLLDVFNEAEKMTSKLRKAQYCLMFADSKLGNSVKKASEKLLKTYLTEEQRKDSVITKYGDFWSGTRFQTDSQRNFERIYELFFGNKNDIRQLINLDAAMLKQNQRESVSPIYTFIKDSSSQSDTELVMDMMRCQLDFFQSNDKDPPKGLLSDWIAIAFSPMAGKQKWMELLLKQATKLEAEKQYNLAASCYIACSHIKDAVELYKRHDMFLEAIVLAKLRLPAKDPTVQELLGVWAKKLQMQEQDLLAATCFILSNIPGSEESAINLIARNDKEPFLFYAACLSEAINEGNKTVRIERWTEKMNERLKKKRNIDAESLELHVNNTLEV